MMCFNCFNFGHTKTRCQQPQPTCGNCAKQHPIAEGERCLEHPFCHRCKSDEHQVSSRKCPDYLKEDAIQHIRVDQGVSYPTARRIFEAANNPKSYAGTANASKDQAITDLTTKFDNFAFEMRTKLAEKDQTIAQLKEQLKANTTKDNNSEFQELRKSIQEMRKEIMKKDKRIQALETALTSGDRMDLTRKHGTIEDLVKKIQSLENVAAEKECENASLRADIAKFQHHFQAQDLASMQPPTKTAKGKKTDEKQNHPPKATGKTRTKNILRNNTATTTFRNVRKIKTRPTMTNRKDLEKHATLRCHNQTPKKTPPWTRT